MKDLTSTLLAAQRTDTRRPFVTLVATNKVAGVIYPIYTRLYSGSEPDAPHAVAVAGDGALIRFCVTPSTNNRRLLRQRVANPGPGSDFTSWADTGQYDVLAVGAAVSGNAVSVFWLDGSRAVYRQLSTNNGATWAAPERIGSTTSTIASGITAAYEDNGDLAVFFTDMETVYLIKCENGVWQPEIAWDKTTGSLNGIAVVYDGDWFLLVTGQDAGGNDRIWSLVYGDGSEVPSGMWSDLKEVAVADDAAGYEYRSPRLTRSDVIRGAFVEQYTGVLPYSRPFTANIVPDGALFEGIWSEPLPFNLNCENGLAIGGRGDALWFSTPSGVFTADLSEVTLDLSAAILSLRETLKEGESKLTVKLSNAGGCFALPGVGELRVLAPGCGLELGLGYVTPAGIEIGTTLDFRLDALEHTMGGGKASLILSVSGGWEALASWRAHTQFRWNEPSFEATCVRDILAFVLGRAGILLDATRASEAAGAFFPDFTVHTGERGEDIVRDLLNLVPDVLAIDSSTARLLEPVSGEAVYRYGSGHVMLDGRFMGAFPGVTRVRVESADETTGETIAVESFDWEAIERGTERPLYIEDRNIGNEEKATVRGEACLKKARIRSSGGVIRVPLNTGQELYDIIEITEAGAGLTGAKRRVLGIESLYDTRKGVYEQRLTLGAV